MVLIYYNISETTLSGTYYKLTLILNREAS
jgi:hypothetical protein